MLKTCTGLYSRIDDVNDFILRDGMIKGKLLLCECLFKFSGLSHYIVSLFFFSQNV